MYSVYTVIEGKRKFRGVFSGKKEADRLARYLRQMLCCEVRVVLD